MVSDCLLIFLLLFVNSLYFSGSRFSFKFLEIVAFVQPNSLANSSTDLPSVKPVRINNFSFSVSLLAKVNYYAVSILFKFIEKKNTLKYQSRE